MTEVTIRLTVEEAEGLLTLLLEAERSEVADSILDKVEDAITTSSLDDEVPEVSEMYAAMGL